MSTPKHARDMTPAEFEAAKAAARTAAAPLAEERLANTKDLPTFNARTATSEEFRARKRALGIKA